MLPEGAEVVLDQLQVQGRDRIIMVLRPAGANGSCPVCQRRSDRIHSWYRRRLHDLPWEGIPVRIELQVRRFFYDADGCPQRIFTERLPKTAHLLCEDLCEGAFADFIRQYLVTAGRRSDIEPDLDNV